MCQFSKSHLVINWLILLSNLQAIFITMTTCHPQDWLVMPTPGDIDFLKVYNVKNNLYGESFTMNGMKK
jgi:hypothetical protein